MDIGGRDEWFEEDREDREPTMRSQSLRDRVSIHHVSMGQPKATFLRYLEENNGKLEEQSVFPRHNSREL